MIELKPTQIKVLKVLGENQDKWLSSNEIVKLSNVNLRYVEIALTKFIDNDLIYQAQDGFYIKFQITPDGLEYIDY